MTDLARINVSWQNFPGAPGLTQFYSLNSSLQGTVDAFRAFFNSLAAFFPTGTTITVPGSGDIISDASGAITAAWSVTTPPAVVTCTGAGAYAGNAGAVIHWLTDAVRHGRRVRGRSFLVPLITTQYETNGTLAASFITSLNTAATTLRTSLAGNGVVWSRPIKAHTEYNKKTGAVKNVAAENGTYAQWTGHRIPDLAVSLRSRRV